MNFEEFRKGLLPYHARQILFVGLGNRFRSDDYAGIEFVNRLKKTLQFNNSGYLVAGTNPENHLEEIINSKNEIIVFVDASNMGLETGELFWINEEDISSSDFSTHAYSLQIISEYIRRNRNIEIKYLGIQKGITEIDNKLSEMLEKRLNKFFENKL